MDGMTLSDIAAVTKHEDGDGFGGSGFWIFALIILLMLGGRGFGENGGVTEADLCSSASFTELKNAVGRNGNDIAQVGCNLQNSLSSLGYDILRNFNDTQARIAETSCTVQRGIDNLNYNGAVHTAEINANTTAGIQRVLDKMAESELAAANRRETELSQRIYQLETQNAINSATYGMVRYPTATTYATNCNPFSFNCGCGNI